MKKRILFSASVFHYINDAATVTVPMVFPLLYSHQVFIKKYSQIGIMSYLGLFLTFIFQIIIANYAYKFEYRHMLLFSCAGISFSLLLITFSAGFFSILVFYLMMRIFTSFYHPIGVANVARTHPDQGLDFAMGIQSGSGNFGVFVSFVTVGYLAQNFDWKIPLYAWSFIIFSLGLISYFSVSKISTLTKKSRKPDFQAWKVVLTGTKRYIPGFVFGGACWGTTIFYAPSLLNHKFNVSLGSTGVYLAFWIGIGTVMTYLFGYLSRLLGRWKISFFGFIGSSIFLFVLGIAHRKEIALLSLFFFGGFLFLIYPAFQSFVGNGVSRKDQTLAFSIVSNVQMLSGAIAGFIAGFLSDSFGINAPFLFLALLGLFVSGYYLKNPVAVNKKSAL
ncbi:MFS transporter [Acidobacteriota bacterium]